MEVLASLSMGTSWAVYHSILLLKQKSYNKVKTVPAICHGGTRGERRYSSYSYLTSALDRGEWSASRPGSALPLSVPIG
jgi:hypothetical protein